MTLSKRSKAKGAEDPGRALRQCEERLASVLELSSDWYWEQDENCRFTLVTGGMLAKSEIDPAAYVGTARWDHGAVPVDHDGNWGEHKAILEARQPFTDFIFKRPPSQGGMRYFSTSGKPIFDESGRFQGYRGVARDITERIRAEQLQRLEHSVVSRIAEAHSATEAMTALIRAICETENWDCGRYFRYDEKAGVLRFAESWGVPDPEIQEFIERSRGLVYTPGVGLIGRVWQSGQPIWAADVRQDARALQAAFSKDIGIRGGFVFPILAEGKTIGTLAFNSRQLRESDDRLMQAIHAIGSQIGQYLRRKEAEEELRRFRAAMDASGDLILLVDPTSLLYVDVNDAASRALGYSREELLTMGPPDIFSVSREDLTRIYARMIAGDLNAPTIKGHYRRKDGSNLPVEAFPRAVRSAEGYVIVSIARDVSERVAAEEALRRFRLAMDNSADMIVLIDRATMRFVDVNDTVCNLLGYSREELLKMGPQDVLPATRETLERAYDEFIANPSGVSGMRSYYICKDGSTIPFESTRHVLHSGDSYIIAAISRDIRERMRAEQLLKLEHSVTRALAEAKSSSEAIKTSIRAVCETEGWACGRYFQVDEKAGVMRFAEAWGVPGELMDRFIEKSRELSYVPGAGLLGRVWQSGQPIWSADIAKDPRIHAGIAREIGMHGSFVFPVISEGRTTGVLIFHSREIREPEERLLQTIGVIGNQIGQFVQRKQAEEALRESEERFRGLSALSSDMFWEQDDQYRFTSFSGVGSEELPHASLESVLGKKPWEQDYINMTADDWAAHRAILEAHQPFHDLELCRLDKSGKKIWIGVSGEPVFDAFGVFKSYRGGGKDITERKQGEERIQYLANHDALTSLPNRAMFSELLNLALLNARRYKRTFAVLFVDLDRFKIINDTLGHEAGDKLLQEMGRRLSETVRSSDVVARLGGDEFVLLVQEVGEPWQVEAVARKILAAAIKPLFIRGQECRVTASIGICMYPADAQDEQSLMKNADIAMYRAKEEGKNTYQFFSQEMNVHSFERMALETSLRRGLERNEFFLHYQAKLDLKTMQITGVEALVRWQHPELGMISPAQFIPLAEETGLIVPIGRWVLNTACVQNVSWQQDGLPPLRMAVNLSARQFADENLLIDIAAALEQSGMKADLLELELTESMVMQHPERAGKVLAAIKQLGVRLAIDDFGVGYSSLAYLKRFPIDTLKVDRSFIRDIPQDTEDMAITQAIIAMGKSLNLTVVGEGVETLEQETFLRDHGCDETQGYYFSRPIASDQFAELLLRNVASLRK